MQSIISVTTLKKNFYFFDLLITHEYVVTLVGMQHLFNLLSEVSQNNHLFWCHFEGDVVFLHVIILQMSTVRRRTKTRSVCPISIHKSNQDSRSEHIIPHFSDMLTKDFKEKIDEYYQNSSYQLPHVMNIREDHVEKNSIKNLNIEEGFNNSNIHEKKNGKRGKNYYTHRTHTECIDTYLRKKKNMKEKEGTYELIANDSSKLADAQCTKEMMGTAYVSNQVDTNYRISMEDKNFKLNMNETNFENNNWKSFMLCMIQSTNAKNSVNYLKEKKIPGRKRKTNKDDYPSNVRKENVLQESMNIDMNTSIKGRKGTTLVALNASINEKNTGNVSNIKAKIIKKKSDSGKEEIEKDEKQMKLDAVSNSNIDINMTRPESKLQGKEPRDKKSGRKVMCTEEEAEEVIKAVSWDESVDMFYENGYFVVVNKNIHKKESEAKIHEKNRETTREISSFDNKNKKDTHQTLLTYVKVNYKSTSVLKGMCQRGIFFPVYSIIHTLLFYHSV
ncbi:hypothetical protein, conserved [Plasmodium gonderi]|uniref:Uncharacterized protein n=1 Tax=Plasmodium gonderi TaxID=77519 RepID=A0A1Y1JFH6_PLAGO|nr:hypothetical protein, conserved [Plasmodium gonderi]GAW81281.1 hypothetical protein, conserved [Plasmodium gonderi]